MTVRKSIGWALALAVFFGAAPVRAQDQSQYAPTTLPDISNVLIGTGIISYNDPVVAEEYLRIHECGLYEKYFGDDFAWSRIRDAEISELAARAPTFPKGFDITTKIWLGEYNLVTNEFDLVPPSDMKNLGLLTVLDENSGDLRPCDRRVSNGFVPRVHPLMLVVKLDQVLNMNGIPMNRATADRLLEIMNARDGQITTDKRWVMMSARVRLTGVDPLSGVTDPLRRTVNATLDDVRFFEGPERKLLLYKKEFKDLKGKTAKN